MVLALSLSTDVKSVGAYAGFAAIVGLALAFWFVHFLYRRKIFLRL